MANKSLFFSRAGKLPPKADARNAAGGLAYSRSNKQALAQYVATGALNSTFYASAEDQLVDVLRLGQAVEPEFVARAALFARRASHMKDMPALLVALLSVRSPGLMAEVFDRVIDSPRMLRTFVQIMRSGQIGRKSLGSLPKRLVQQWLDNRSDEQLFRASVGTRPSLADIIKLVHPKPQSASRAALYGYLIGRAYDTAALPEVVRQFEAFKIDPSRFGAAEVPEVPMDLLTGLNLRPEHWKELARRASWQSLRMNLNTFARHGAFADQEEVLRAASKLRDEAEIRSSRVLPYQLLAAFVYASEWVPPRLKVALQDAMDIAIQNVPAMSGRVWVFPDVSGSMQSAITGHRAGSTSAVRCIDVAALVAAAVLRRNPEARVLPFSDDVINVELNPLDSVMTNARILSQLPNGGTDASAPLRRLNGKGQTGDLILYVSDNESWMDSQGRSVFGRATGMMEQWEIFKHRNPNAKLVCLDLQPSATVQAPDRTDILNIGGFSDSVFDTIAEFERGRLSDDHWVGVIEQESL